MSENKTTLGKMLQRASNDRGFPLRPTEWDEVAEIIAAEGIRRWLRDLPPGDKGLAEAYDRGYRIVEPLTWHWATLAHEWAETTEKQRRATSAGVAAVLAAHRARLGDNAAIAELHDCLIEKGWVLPDEAHMKAAGEGISLTVDETLKLRAEIERLKEELANSYKERGLSGRRFYDESKKLKEEIEQHKREYAALQSTRAASASPVVIAPYTDEQVAEARQTYLHSQHYATSAWAQWKELPDSTRAEHIDAIAAIRPMFCAEELADAKHELKQIAERMKARDRQHEITYRLLSNERDAAKQRLAEAEAAKLESCPSCEATCECGSAIPVAYIVTDPSCATVPWINVNGVRYVPEVEQQQNYFLERKDEV